MDLTWTVLEQVHNHFRNVASRIISEGGEVAPMLFAVRLNSRGRVVRMTALPPELVAQFMRSDDSKDLFRELLQDLLDEHSDAHAEIAAALRAKPDLLVQINEAWVAELDTPMVHEAPIRPSQHLQRREALLVTLHAPAETVPVWHDIVAGPPRKVVNRKFPSRSDVANISGRFALQEEGAPARSTRH